VKTRAKTALAAVGTLALATALFTAAGAGNARMLAARTAWQAAPGGGVEGMPPGVAATTILLGGFRGLAADWLWMRAGDLQDRGRYFELAQLSAWIARMQPRSPAIRAYHAWNMAYNLSAMSGDADGKWRWVREGVRLLEEDGMRDCAGSAALHRELAWLFLHKMGSGDDPEAGTYRERWAVEARARIAERGGVFPDAAAVAEIDAAFPGLDWTGVQAAAVYWAWTGLPHARGASEDLALRRIVYQALFQLLRDGRTDLAAATARYVRDTAARHPKNPAMQALVARMGG